MTPKYLPFFAVVIFLTRMAPASVLAGQSYVVDGDTFVKNGVKYRLWGIDAPELSQSCQNQVGESYSCGLKAKKHLQNLMAGREIECRQMARAKKETRLVARCFLDGKDVGQMMVQDGWATEYKFFSKGIYTSEENEARSNGRGLWSGYFENPRDWRKSHGN